MTNARTSETPALPPVVRVERRGDLAWVTIDNPPVNATSTAVRAGLAAAVAELAGARLAALVCAGKTFIAGGDITEFDAPPQEPHLPDVVQMIEESEVPFVALMHGNVLGGGFEIAMACAWRIAAPKTRFGLPEVNLGLIPGAGGSQRLPRLVGMAAAIDIACRGRIVSAEEMLEMGGIDRIAEDLPAAFEALAADLPPRPVALSRRAMPACDPALIAAAEADLRKTARGRKAPLENLAALQWAAEPFETGQRRERARHLALRHTPEARALRHLFLAERAAARPAAIRGVPAREISRLAVVGGGLMGAGIAASALSAGLKVRLIERDEAAAEAARERVAGLLGGAVKRGKMTQAARDAALAGFATGADYALAAGADLAIEAVFEDLGVKRAAFARLAEVLASDAILATNTSYLDPREIFAGIAAPERCLGLHFFSPAHIMKLLEIVPLPETGADVLATGFVLAKRMRKQPVLAGICEGFIGNRILAAYRREAEYLLADGALPDEVDAAMRGFGMAMGPFEAQDMAGLQIAWANRKRQAATRPPSERYIPIADRLCEAGRLGRRAGKGWYDYAGDGTPRRAREVEALIEDHARQEGITRHSFDADEIVARLLAVMANEGLHILAEGIAGQAGDIDVVEVHGYGFPRWRGGPMHYAEEIGWPQTSAAMARVAAQSPGAWHMAQMPAQAKG